jgi:ribosome-associated protein
MLVVSDDLSIPLSELRFTFARSAGPGGQNVNKVNTKATLRWHVTESPSLPEPVRERFLARYRRRITGEGEVLVTSQRYRDQGRNVADCLSKLQAMLVEVARPPKRRKKTRPTASSRAKRLSNKRQRSQTKSLRRSPRGEE